jgi:uncharacterized peroxidase-related enzyme
MAFIDVIHPDQAEGKLQEIYDDLKAKRGKLAKVHQIQSLNPESIVNHMDLYMTVMFGKSPLRRYQREMMAVVTSVENDCLYCQQHHSQALLHFWKDEQQVEQLKKDYRKVELSPVDQLLCEYAQALTKSPGKMTEDKFVQPLRNEGLSDRAILDATLVISYFNFVNRIVLGLGVPLESDEGKGYKYE